MTTNVHGGEDHASPAPERLAHAAFRAAGGVGSIRPVATGMSSAAWTGEIAGRAHVVRVPVGDGRRPVPAYEREAALLELLADLDLPTPRSRIVRVDGEVCSVSPLLRGRPVTAGDWTPRLIQEVAAVLTCVHSVPPESAVELDVVARFHLASIWPLDGSDLAAHSVAVRWPQLVESIDRLRDDIAAAHAGAATVVHSDLHRQHVLIEAGGLTGLLDFGDSFPGPAAWDHACLRYYHGASVQRAVAAAMGSSAPAEREVDLLGVAWGLYKLAKTPDRVDVVDRVAELFRSFRTVDLEPPTD